MKNQIKQTAIRLTATLLCAGAMTAQAELITNGGFESGFSGWTRTDQAGSDGTFSLQTGTQSPINMFTVAAPPEGTTAAMTDALGPGSHILYQDFLVPMSISVPYVASFYLYFNNTAPDFFTADHLDFATPDLNQQARVDILTTSADPFSVAAGDVLQNLYQSRPGFPLVSGYTQVFSDVTALLQAHAGDTLRIRFAEVDNVLTFNLGVDGVSVNEVPEPSTWLMTMGGLAIAMAMRMRRS